MDKTWDKHKAFGEQKRYPNELESAYWRTDQAYTVKMCIQAVDRLFEVAGGNCRYSDNEVQRLFRDSHMTAAHAYTDYDVCKQILGRALMGMEADLTMVWPRGSKIRGGSHLLFVLGLCWRVLIQNNLYQKKRPFSLAGNRTGDHWLWLYYC